MIDEQEFIRRQEDREEEEEKILNQVSTQSMEQRNQLETRQQAGRVDRVSYPMGQTEVPAVSLSSFMKTKEKNENEEDNISQTVDEQVAGFHIIGQDATNQVLQVNLYPKQKIFVKGKILYANFPFTLKNYYGYPDIYTFVKEFIESGYHPLRKMHNDKPHIAYLGISRSGGKVLCIDNDIYGDDICVRPARIILSNVNHENSSIVKHNELSNLQNRVKVNQKKKIEKTLIILQSKSNNVIIEKYLGPKQTFYVQQNLILALSRSVKVTDRSLMGLSNAKLEGPGWVFVENSSMSVFRENKILTFFGAYLFYLILMTLFNPRNWMDD